MTNKKNKKTRTVAFFMGSHWKAIMGGAQYQVKCLIDEIVQKCELNIYYICKYVNEKYTTDKYKIVQFNSNPNSKISIPFITEAKETYKVLESIKPDLIYRRGLNADVYYIARYSRLNACKTIFHIAHDYDVIPYKTHGNIFKQIIHKKISEVGLKRMDYIISQTKKQSFLLKKHYGRDTALIVPNFHPWSPHKINKPKSPINVTWVANFKENKRPELFVKLAECFKSNKNINFFMIGRPGSKKYQKLHQKIKECDNIKYLGERRIDEVNEILSISHLFINTSISEGFPNTFIQAWLRKVPVISLSVDVDNVLDKNNIGIYAETFDNMVRIVSELIDKSEKRNEMGENAIRYAIKNHSTKNAGKIINLMESSLIRIH